MKIIQETGDLLNTPIDSIIVHACSLSGTWDRGVASSIKSVYPGASSAYVMHIMKNNDKQTSNLVGSTFIWSDKYMPSHAVACLITSRLHGRSKNPKEEILEHTKTSFISLLQQVHTRPALQNKPIYLCKINAGLFEVPWKDTYDVLESIDSSKYGIDSVTVMSIE